MPQSSSLNRRIVLASRPSGEPADSDFRLETGAVPEPGPGQLLLRTVYLSLDPYMRGRMSDAPSYAEPVQVGQPMVGGTVARVVASRHADYPVGEWVLSQSGWQDYAVSDGSGLLKLGSAPERPSYSLGVLGMPGFTGWYGFTQIGKPTAGETLAETLAHPQVAAMRMVLEVARRDGGSMPLVGVPLNLSATPAAPARPSAPRRCAPWAASIPIAGTSCWRIMRWSTA